MQKKKLRYDKLFMKIATDSAEMSFCERAKVGAVIVKDNRVLVNAWNGTPSGYANCCEELSNDVEMFSRCCNAKIYELDDKLYCSNCNNKIGFVDRLSDDLKREVGGFVIKPNIKTNHKIVIHAEANALLFAAKNGIATNNCDMYVTLSPCSECAKMIVQSGIKRVVYKEKYRDTSGIDFLKAVGIVVEQFKKELNA